MILEVFSKINDSVILFYDDRKKSDPSFGSYFKGDSIYVALAAFQIWL